MRAFQILIVEDELLVAEDIRESLRKRGYEVLGIASSEKAALRILEKQDPDLVLLDIHLGKGGDGIELASKIRSKRPVPVIYLTAYVDESTIERAQETMPYGYLVKPCHEAELYAAIKIALHKFREEQKQDSSLSSLKALDHYIDHRIQHMLHNGVRFPSQWAIPSPQEGLTPREREMLEYIGAGYTMQEISNRLHLSVHTVRTHRYRIMRKLDIHDIEKLVHYVLSNGWLPHDG